MPEMMVISGSGHGCMHQRRGDMAGGWLGAAAADAACIVCPYYGYRRSISGVVGSDGINRPHAGDASSVCTAQLAWYELAIRRLVCARWCAQISYTLRQPVGTADGKISMARAEKRARAPEWWQSGLWSDVTDGAVVRAGIYIRSGLSIGRGAKHPGRPAYSTGRGTAGGKGYAVCGMRSVVCGPGDGKQGKVAHTHTPTLGTFWLISSCAARQQLRVRHPCSRAEANAWPGAINPRRGEPETRPGNPVRRVGQPSGKALAGGRGRDRNPGARRPWADQEQSLHPATHAVYSVCRWRSHHRTASWYTCRTCTTQFHVASLWAALWAALAVGGVVPRQPGPCSYRSFPATLTNQLHSKAGGCPSASTFAASSPTPTRRL